VPEDGGSEVSWNEFYVWVVYGINPETREKHGIIFCSFSEAVHKCPELIRQYLRPRHVAIKDLKGSRIESALDYREWNENDERNQNK
jgi:Fe-S cluster assembly scaffold protein SufB